MGQHCGGDALRLRSSRWCKPRSPKIDVGNQNIDDPPKKSRCNRSDHGPLQQTALIMDLSVARTLPDPPSVSYAIFRFVSSKWTRDKPSGILLLVSVAVPQASEKRLRSLPCDPIKRRSIRGSVEGRREGQILHRYYRAPSEARSSPPQAPRSAIAGLETQQAAGRLYESAGRNHLLNPWVRFPRFVNPNASSSLAAPVRIFCISTSPGEFKW